MDISINLSGIQVGKRYTLEFCLSEDGQVVKKTVPSKPAKTPPKKNTGPSLEDFEEKETTKTGPKLQEPKKTISDFKVESSIDKDKLDV